MIDAVVVSIGESQLDRCLESVKKQVVPFSNIIHVDGVVPEAEAFKKGIEQVKEKWAMVIGGDFILNDDATIEGIKKIKEYTSIKIGGFLFGLFDSFIQRIINSCTVYNTEAVRSTTWHDTLRNDRRAIHEMESRGWVFKRFFRGREIIVIGTHFDDPDEFQIFRRYFVAGIKRNPSLPLIQDLYKRTKDKRYKLAIQAINYGWSKSQNSYSTSHNVDYDRRMFEEFKHEDLNSYSSIQ